MGRLPGLPVLLAVPGMGLLLACGDDPVRPSSVPPSHTVVHDGVFHAPGDRSPQSNCTECHGGDLRGGDGGEPSCFTCHGAVWG